MAKIENDKYFTATTLAKYCIDKTYEVIGYDNISEIIEPSAGSGSFSNQIDKVCWSYDIEPQSENIIKQDFLELDCKYEQGRLIIGNPPYGRCLSLAQKFYKKSVEIADYISFILPISQLNNINSMYEFDLVYSEDLGKQFYTDRNLHCCLNIYKRPEYELNKKPITKLKDVEIIRQDSTKFNDVKEDIRMCYWGDGSAGKILKDGEKYSAEYKIVIHNKKYKDEIIKLLNEVNWHNILNKIAMLKIQQFHIVKYLKDNIMDLE